MAKVCRPHGFYPCENFFAGAESSSNYCRDSFALANRQGVDGGGFVEMTLRHTVRLLIGVAVGACALLGGIWVLVLLLGNDVTLYQGKPISYWSEQLVRQPPSDQAIQVLNGVLIPYLTNQMFSDTNDSRMRMALVEQLNGLPGIHIYYVPQRGRRIQAIMDLGSLGPRAKGSVSALYQALQHQDEFLCGPAAIALAKIQAEPDQTVPALLRCLLDREGRGRPDVVEALGEFGPKARAAVPALVKLLADHSSKDIVEAVPAALKKIDPETALKVGVK